MFTHLTGQARRVLQIAHREAFGRNHDYLGTEHLLFAMLHESTGGVRRILETCGVPANALIDELDDELVPANRVLDIEKLPLTGSVQRALHVAQAEASVTKSQVGLEHLLLGVLQEEDSQAAQILHNWGIDLERARAEVAKRDVAENRDHQVATSLPPIPGTRRDPTPEELEDAITREILPREWRPGQASGLQFVNVQALENQIRGTQIALGAVIGAFAMVDMYGWQGLFGGAMLGILVAAFQSSLLGALFGAGLGFFVGLQHVKVGAWLVGLTTATGAFIGSWLGNVWRVAAVQSAPPRRQEEDDDMD